MELIIDKKTKSGRLTLTDDLSISRATSLREAIEQALKKVKHLTVDIGQARGVDLSFLQLLCSAHRSATVMNKSMTLAGKSNEALQKAVDENGYGRTSGCVLDKTSTCLWVVRDDE
ncbi:MAG: STAS domain-containing protein [Smithellaceae bacterium]